ncbi:MAG: glutathione S-transferase N-terminal domain-containing protein [Alphaproteobacteria bacterium]|nr:glutathione S-transferase N-terminal domain-containing protein [Alphaproteobacteria bacterium]
MQLYTWPTSPFGAKVWAVAIATGLNTSIIKVPYHPWEADPELSKLNPLNKIPVLITPNGEALYDSPVICEYLIEQAGMDELLENKWCNLRQQALADGIMDAGVLTRYETHFRPSQLQCKDWLNRQLNAINRSLDVLNQEKLNDRLDMGTISIATAIAYLDLRKVCDWQEHRQQLASWYNNISSHPALVQSRPTDYPLPENLIKLKE